MSTWKVYVHTGSSTPVGVTTDHPDFTGVYESLGPGQKLYALPDAMYWIGKRMTPGDVVMTIGVAPVGPVCPACDNECSGVWMDFGVGFTEYWGAPGVDVDMRYVSACCEAQLPEPQQRDDE